MNELIVVALIGGRRCAFRAEDVQSVVEIGAITPIPRTPDHIAGLAALRSQALTVFDCRLAIGLKDRADRTDGRAIVVRVEGHSYALLVDVIEDVATAQSEASSITGGFGEQWRGIARGMVETDRGPALLIDVEVLIGGPAQVPAAA